MFEFGLVRFSDSLVGDGFCDRLIREVDSDFRHSEGGKNIFEKEAPDATFVKGFYITLFGVWGDVGVDDLEKLFAPRHAGV